MTYERTAIVLEANGKSLQWTKIGALNNYWTKAGNYFTLSTELTIPVV